MNNNFLKYFDSYFNVVDSYKGSIPVRPELMKAKLANMEVLDIYDPMTNSKKRA